MSKLELDKTKKEEEKMEKKRNIQTQRDACSYTQESYKNTKPDAIIYTQRT